MTTMSSMEQQLDDITECPICSDSFTDPRSLPCIHTFCLKCLEQYGRGKQSGTKMTCPSCRTEFTIPCSGFSGLPKNFFIGKMLQIKNLSSGQPTDVCEVCEAKNKDDPKRTAVAVKFCVECQEKLCISCSKDHLSHKMLRGHRLIDIDKVRGPESAEIFRATIDTCSKHKDQAMNMFCNDCKTPICVVCYVASHKQHDCSDINDVVEKFRQQMTADVDSLGNGAGKLHMLLGSIEQQKQDFVKQLAGARDVIVQKAEELKQVVESNKKVLLGVLAVREQDVSKKLDNLSQEIKRHASAVESLMKYTKELSTKGAVCDIAQEASSLHDRVGELLKIDAIEKSRNKMHTIDVKYTETSAVPWISNLIGCVDVQVKARKVPQPTTPTLAKILQTRTNMVCMTSLKNQLFVTGLKVNEIEVYDTVTFALQRNITVSDLQQVRYLTSCAVNNCLYASDPIACSVFRVEVSGGITFWNVGAKPAGLSVNSNSNVVVTLSDDSCVREYTTKGSLIRQISLPHKPNHIIQLTNGQFVMSSSQGVCIVNEIGQITSQYSNTSRESVRLNQPMGLALVENGCILVADRGLEQIVVLNSSLTAARVLALPDDVELKTKFKLMSPWALQFDEPRGRLYIGECNEDNQNNPQNIGQDQRPPSEQFQQGVTKFGVGIRSKRAGCEQAEHDRRSGRFSPENNGARPLFTQMKKNYRPTARVSITDNVFNVGNDLD